MTALKTIIEGFVAAVQACVPTTDAGAPGEFRDLPRGQLLANDGRDLFFEVLADGGNMLNVVGSGTSRNSCDVTLRVSFHNEGRSRTNASALYAQNAFRLRSFVAEHLRQNVANVKNVYTENQWRTVLTQNPQRVIVEIPFRIIFDETIYLPT